MIENRASFSDYLTLARFDHWFKNIFMLPGTIFAIAYFEFEFSIEWLIQYFVGIISLCFVASSNYIINEYIDARFDKFHPIKKNRKTVQKSIDKRIITLEYFSFLVVGLAFGWLINAYFFLVLLSLAVMGLIYNVPPLRTKDKPYIDVLSESVNNPIRFTLGWFLVTTDFWPQSSILIAYWMAGAFLMATKRFAEYRFLSDPFLARKYRKSFSFYNEENLLISIFFYGLTSTFFLGIFLVKNKIELLLSFPFFALLFAWYLKIGLKENSIVQRPEKLYRNRMFILYVIFLCCLIIVLLFLNIKFLNYFLKKNF